MGGSVGRQHPPTPTIHVLIAELKPPLNLTPLNLTVDMRPLADTVPGETKKTLCRISFLVTSRISLVTFTSLPTVGGTRRKSRILKEKEPCSDLRDSQGLGKSPVPVPKHVRTWLVCLNIAAV